MSTKAVPRRSGRPSPSTVRAAVDSEPPRQSRARFSLVLWPAAVVSAGLLTAYYCLWLEQFPQMDFRVYRMGGQHVFNGALYSSHITVLGRHLVFTYPPVSAVLFWPFSFFSNHVDQIVWDALDIVALTALMAVSLAAARSRSVVRSDWRTALLLAAPIGFLLWPVRYNLNLGQINILLALMIVTDLTVGLSWGSKRMPRGVLVGLAAAIKLTPLVFVAYLVVSRQWRAARNAALSFLVATGIMFVVAPRASWLYFTKDAFDVSRVGNDHGIGNQSLLAALYRAHLPLPSASTELILLGVLCLGVATAAAAYRHSSAMLGVLVCAATGLLVSPISWPHHYVWIVPALIWLAIGIDRPAKGGWWAVAGALAFITIPPLSAGAGAIWYLRDDTYALTALAFLALVATMLEIRRHRPVSARPNVSPREPLSGDA